MRRASRGTIFWGAALVSAGLVILAVQVGYVSAESLSDVSRFWPLLLIGAGVAIILAGTLGALATLLAGILLGVLVGGLIAGGVSFSGACGTDKVGPLTAYQEGSFDGGADVDIDLNCVALEVAGGAGSDWAIEADADSADLLEVTAATDRLEVRADDTVGVGLGGRLHVGVTVPGAEGTNLSGSLNAGEATFDLAGGQWGDISLTGNAVSIQVDLSGAAARTVIASLNAGAMNLQLTDDTRLASLELSANAGSYEVCASDGLGLIIRVGSNVATGHNLDEVGLLQDGDLWQTRNYAAARNHVRIEFSGNAASFNLNPEGGCS